MGLLDFFRSKGLSASPAVLDGSLRGGFTSELAHERFPYTENARIRSAFVEVQNSSYAWIYDKQPAVRRVIEYIASNVSQLALGLYERGADGERRQIGAHAAVELLHEPNTFTPPKLFLFDVAIQFLVNDNAYVLKIRDPDGQVRGLMTIPSGRVGLVGQSLYAVDAYRVWDSRGLQIEPDFDPSDVIHWRGHDPQEPRRGFSKLETLREVLAEEAASQAANTELLNSGLAQPGWISRPLEAPPLSEPAARRFEENAASRLKEANRRWPMFEEGMELHPFGVSPKDAEMRSFREFAGEEVASLFGMKAIPPTTPEERNQFYNDVLAPLCERFAEAFDLGLLKQEYLESDLYFSFDLDEKLNGDERLKALVSATGRPVLLTDEARAMLGKPPVPGGDELVTPLNVQVGDNPKPSPAVMPIQDPNGPPQDGSHCLASGNGKADHLIPRRQRADDRRDGWARKHENDLRAHFSEQEAGTKATGKADLAARLNRLGRRQVESEGSLVAQRLAGSFDASFTTNYIAAKARDVAKEIDAQTAADIAELGASDAFERARNVRAGGIAMKLASDVAAFAAKEATRQAPDTRFRTVTIAGGDCETCAPFQGSWPIDEVPGWPGYHNNCNCVADVT